MASFASVSPLTLFRATRKARRKFILSWNLWVEMAPALSVRRKEASFMKNDFAGVKNTQNGTERTPHREQIICVRRGCCFHSISNFRLLCMILWLLLMKVQQSFPFNRKRLSHKCVFLLAPSPSKPCVGLINQEHISLTDTWWLKRCMIKKILFS